MSKINKTESYSLICTKDILNYINTRDKIELSLCCKYIFEKCNRFRIERYSFDTREFKMFIDDTQEEGIGWIDDNYHLKLEYFDDIINMYKKYLLALTYGAQDYNLLEYFCLNFINLNSLWLDYIAIPKNSLKQIIENLPNLNSLTLWSIEVAYSKSDNQSDCFKYPNSLKELKWENCIEFQLDGADLATFKQRSLSKIINNTGLLDISLNLVKTLKSLYWLYIDDYDIQLFSEIITNNRELISLTTSLHSLNFDTLKCISTHLNLSKLKIIDIPDGTTIDELIYLPNIKTLEFSYLFEITESINSLIGCCTNLEELTIYPVIGQDECIINYIKNLHNLKRLTIIATSYFPSIFYSILPVSNLEQLKIISEYPLKLNFNNFTNLKELKKITNTSPSCNWNGKLKYENLDGWRMLNYPQSIQYWKL